MAAPPRSPSRFRRLALTHAAMMGAEASMVVALADSFFFDVDLDAARGRIMLFLLVSFAPFIVIAPLIGPVIDRVRGGRRFVVQLVAIARIVVQVLMMRYVDQLALFPLVFVALVLQKTYVVSKSALVPSVVRSEQELVEANSKLGLIAGVTGAVAVIPAAVLQIVFGATATLGYGVVLFAVALVAATQLPREVVIVPAGSGRTARLRLPLALRAAADAMWILRGCVGFILFHLAFWFRSEGYATVWFGLAVGLSTLGTMLGNLTGPRVRRRMREETMVVSALAIPAGAGVVTAFLGGPLAGILLAVAVHFSAGIGRLAFESIVQRDAPGVNRGQVFARYETRFQLGWVIGATVPVMVAIPGALGFGLVAAATVFGGFLYRRGSAGPQPRRGRPNPGGVGGRGRPPGRVTRR